MDLLGKRPQLLGDRVDLLGKIGVSAKQVSLILGEFLSVFRYSFSSFAWSVRVCAFWAMMTTSPV